MATERAHPFLEDHRMPELTVTFVNLAGPRLKDHARLLWAETAAPLPAATGCKAFPCGF